jgi:hypothetical protein
MPVNLVEASFDQIRKIPGVQVQNIDITKCNNPTFSADGRNVLAENAPRPQACDQRGTSQCPNGTGGMANVPTAVLASAAPTGGTPAASGGTPAAGGGTPAAGAGTPAAGAGTPAASGGAGTPATGAGAGTPVAGGGAGAPAAGGGSGTPQVASAGPVNTVLTADGTVVDAVTGQPVTDPLLAGNCDPDTGLCGGGVLTADGVPVANQAAAGAGTPAAAGPVVATTLDPASGWNTSLAFVLLVIALLLALVLVPAFAWRRFTERPT